ncbi:MAG: D-Ala-D-Ala carboxypeptidase family metallohydrolase [Gammaproteobacteria bacterium]
MNLVYFSETELRCKCGCGQVKMNSSFLEKLIALREQLGFPFIITSAYRCPKHNQQASSTGIDGPHTTGRAIDIAVSGEKAYKLIQAAPAFNMTGIGVKQAGPHASRFIHLDDLQSKDGFPRPWVWGY